MKSLSVLLLLACGSIATAQDLDDGDLSGTTPLRVRTWDLVNTRFTLLPRANNARMALELKNNQGFPNLVQQWGELKPLVRTRDNNGTPAAIDAANDVICGWAIAEDGMNFIVHRAAKQDQIQTILKVEPVTFTVEFDVLMATSEDDRQQLLKKYFEVLSYTLDIYEVPGGDKDMRAPAAATKLANGTLVNNVSSTSDTGVAVPWNNKITMTGEWIPRVAGVYEIRAKARVRGKLELGAEAEVQTLETNIRVMALDQSVEVRLLDLQRSNFQK